MQQDPWLAQFVAVVVSVALFTLVHAPFDVGPIAFLALAPFAMVFANPHLPCSTARAGAWGFAFGLLASMAIVGPWMFTAATDYFDQGRLWAFGFTLAVCATHVALFHVPALALMPSLAAAPPLVRALGIACLWTACEALRAHFLVGNAWALLGHAFHDVPLLREAAAIGGTWILGWSAALTGAAVGVALQHGLPRHAARRCGMLAAGAPIGLVLLGLLARSANDSAAPLPPLRVAVVQAGIAAGDLWDPAQRVDHWRAYAEATATLEAGSVDLVVWPESALPFLLDADAAARARLSALAARLGAALLIGAPRSAATEPGRASLHNSAWWFPAAGGEPEVYDKRRLLPFVETAPFGFASLGPATPYAAGLRGVLFEVRGWRVAPLICLEAVPPELSREAALAGADLLVNLSNDAWFAGGAGPEQHHAMSVLRAVEVRRPMVRAANGGVSAILDAGGAALAPTLRRERGVLRAEVPPPPRHDTVYSATGDAVLWLSVFGLALALASARSGLASNRPRCVDPTHSG